MPVVKIVKKSASTANPLAMPSTEKQLQRTELSGMRGAEKEQKKAENAIAKAEEKRVREETKRVEKEQAGEKREHERKIKSICKDFIARRIQLVKFKQGLFLNKNCLTKPVKSYLRELKKTKKVLPEHEGSVWKAVRNAQCNSLEEFREKIKVNAKKVKEAERARAKEKRESLKALRASLIKKIDACLKETGAIEEWDADTFDEVKFLSSIGIECEEEDED
jgi:hypothetical protein